MSGWSCGCGFDPMSVSPTFGADWYRAHRAHHLAVFPDVDPVTRANLDMPLEERTCSS